MLFTVLFTHPSGQARSPARARMDVEDDACVDAPSAVFSPKMSQHQHWYHRLHGGAPSHVLAPMVDQSELAYRLLCRRHGTTLCYTPMFSAKQFAESELYRNTMFGPLDGEGEDRPLVVQFAGHDPASLLASAKHVQHRCNAVDLNLGCPQKIAKRGRYGAWLLHERELLKEIVSTLHCHLDCPVTCKIRLAQEDNFQSSRASISETVDLARMLQGAGASLIARTPSRPIVAGGYVSPSTRHP